MQTKQKSKFLQITCPRCKSLRIVFGKSTTKVKCYNCNQLLTKSTGGKTRVKARVQRVL